MSDPMRLISAERTVHLMPDAKVAEQLSKLDGFWNDGAKERADQDLSAVRDDSLRVELAEDGIETAMPDRLRDLIRPRARLPLAPIAFAASLACAAVFGGLYWQASTPSDIRPAPNAASTGPDPYVLANPARPAAGAPQEVGPATGSGVQSVTERSSAYDVDLTRAEMHEMQRLLNRLGYGPVVQNGLPSESLDKAIYQFRADKGLDPDDIQPREVLVMLRLAARVEELRARPTGITE